MRRSHDRNNKVFPRPTVSAWSDACRVVLAQTKVNDQSNEITAIPELLDLLDLPGPIITIDAMGAQRAICQKIIDHGGDSVISLKGNQGTFREDVELFFKNPESMIEPKWEEWDQGQGRIEHRTGSSHRRDSLASRDPSVARFTLDFSDLFHSGNPKRKDN